MNYYKQGDAAKADKIKAAFEKLGFDVGTNSCAQKGLYFTFDGKVCYTDDYVYPRDMMLETFIKKDHDYQELELSVEPKFKFKVGDWIVQNDNGTVSQITKTINGKDEHGEYRAYEHTNGYFAECFENEYHLWTIEDAKDGDVLVNDAGCIFINAGFEKDDKVTLACYCYVSVQGIFYEEDYKTGSWLYVSHIHPATKEQCDLLFKKMKEAGYTWDDEKKELKKKHYDISNFHAGMPVLVRETSLNAWQYVLFSHCYVGGDGLTRFNAGLVGYTQCIPFNDDTKHLLGTTDMPSVEFINW